MGVCHTGCQTVVPLSMQVTFYLEVLGTSIGRSYGFRGLYSLLTVGRKYGWKRTESQEVKELRCRKVTSLSAAVSKNVSIPVCERQK